MSKLFDWLWEKIAGAFEWLVQELWGLLRDFFAALWDFVVDAFVNLLDLVVGGFVALLSAIPVPSVFSQGLGSLWSQLDGGVMWIASSAGLPTALAMIGSAYLFRLARKVVTLFQW
jgi:hypothetical protein